METLNPQSVLARAFRKLNKEEVIAYLNKKGIAWMTDKKDKTKAALESVFLGIENSLTSEDIKDLTEMSVLVKKKGLSAYTYKFVNLGVFESLSQEELELKILGSHVVSSTFEVVVVSFNNTHEELELNLKVKVYDAFWKTNVRDLNTLTGIYENKITFNKRDKTASVEVSDDELEMVIRQFIINRTQINLEPFLIGAANIPDLVEDSASIKTMLVFDYVYNRLSLNGISSRFNDVRFHMTNVERSGGVKAVKVYGSDIIASEEACKYITLKNDIVSFKTTSLFQGSPVNIQFILKGKDFDMLKIVILDKKSDSYKQDLMEVLQLQYIEMCKHGFKDIMNTRSKLRPIYDAFIARNS
ncbi:hypothetical protein L1279_003489 [Planomicrobium sp. HSC-17F08]|nr:hypothetical protein [Planomicrobium sp. HSC-17F08]